MDKKTRVGCHTCKHFKECLSKSVNCDFPNGWEPSVKAEKLGKRMNETQRDSGLRESQ